MKKPLALLTILLGTILLATMSCNKGPAASALSGDPPVFTGGYDLRRNEYENSRREISFIAATRERTREIRDFYSRWAENRGWRLVLPTEDRWSVDEWISFGLPEARTHQFAATWRNADGSESLSLALLQRGDGGPIEVFLLLGPYHVVSNPTEPLMTARDLEERLRNSR